jgi:hypothetical protein
MPKTVRFHAICGAVLHGRPGQVCQRAPVKGGSKCPYHGGKSSGPTSPEGKAALAARNRLRAAERRLRIARGGDPATGKPGPKPKAAHSLSGGRGAPPAKDAAAPNARPPWPRNGYVGGPRVRELEASERRFVRELNAAPVDLEAQLARAAGYEPLRLSCRELEHVLIAFVATMRADVEDRLAAFVEAEHQVRRDGESAIAHRLDRLRFEIDAYIGRLNTAKTLVVLRAEERERQERERAYAVAVGVVAGRDQRAEERRAASPLPQTGPHFITAPLRS